MQRREVAAEAPRVPEPRLSGNRLALAGAVLYFLEWVAILGFGAGTAPTDPGTSPKDIVAEYSGHATAIALAAGWYSLVLPGRVLFVAGARAPLRRGAHSASTTPPGAPLTISPWAGVGGL